MAPKQVASEANQRDLTEAQSLAEIGLTQRPILWSSPIFQGVVLGVLVWILWAGPYWLYKWNFDTLQGQMPGLTKLLTKEPMFGRVMSSWVNMFSVICFWVSSCWFSASTNCCCSSTSFFVTASRALMVATICF